LLDDWNGWNGWSETDLILFSTLRTLSIAKSVKFSAKAKAFSAKMALHGGVELLTDRAI
jgi:glutaredoxin 2